MKGASIIFDTNAYIEFCNKYALDLNLVLREVDNLRAKERLLNIENFAAPSTLLELISHLASPSDPFYGVSKCSLLSLYRHTKTENSLYIKIIADSETLLAKYLFNYDYQELVQKWKEIANLIAQIYNSPDDNNIARMRSDILQISHFVLNVENQFISDMFKFVVKGLNSSATDWAPLVNDAKTKRRFLDFINSEVAIIDLAKMYVIKTCIIAGIEPRDINIEILAEKVRSNFPAALKIYMIILKRIAETGCDITKGSRRNWVWDMQLLFYITPNSLLNKRIILVSSDRDIRKAAQISRMSNSVIRLNDYLEFSARGQANLDIT
jgi:hypothetical protein